MEFCSMTHINIIKSCAIESHRSHDKLSTLDVKAWEKTANWGRGGLEGQAIGGGTYQS